MTDFSGKTVRVDHPTLKKLFGVAVPIEALDLVFAAPPETTAKDMRATLILMSAEWDQAKFYLDRLRRAADSIVESVNAASLRLAVAEEPERTYLISDFSDAAENLEAADQDALFLRHGREE